MALWVRGGLCQLLPFEIGEYCEAADGSGNLPPDALFLQFSGALQPRRSASVTAPMLTKQLERLAVPGVFPTGQRGVMAAHVSRHGADCLFLVLPWQRTPSLQFSATDWLLKPDLPSVSWNSTAGHSAGCPTSPSHTWRGCEDERHHSLEHVRAWINCSNLYSYVP
jgi:hypothetical protein